ncbi:hypothetical protein [Pollutibacter soli]|uniref:hypothetical protein n=1 Tax=Pollutibacter soli TaxID=3034157 RepID=UPI0030138A84
MAKIARVKLSTDIIGTDVPQIKIVEIDSKHFMVLTFEISSTKLDAVRTTSPAEKKDYRDVHYDINRASQGNVQIKFYDIDDRSSRLEINSVIATKIPGSGG